MKRSFWLSVAIFSFTCIACGAPVVKDKSSITGYWSVAKAFRDKRETKLLGDVFFRFDADGKMITNLPNTSEEATDFEIKEDKIIQKTPTPITYSIQELVDSNMVLLLEMNNTPFEIHLKKSAIPPAPPVDSLEMKADTL